METVYQIAGISRQGHSQFRHQVTAKEELQTSVLSRVRQARLSHPRMGSRPLYKMLDIQGMGINKFEQILSAEGLGIQRKRNKHKTTDGHLCKDAVTNRVNGKELDGLNQLWVSDITYFQTGVKTFYIIMILDVYSRRILAANIYQDMFAYNNLLVLKTCIKLRGISDFSGKLIHHSDKGSQYMSYAYKSMLTEHGIVLSVAENSLQNAYAERINGTIKNDYLQFFQTENLSQLRRHLTKSVKLYNCERPHSSLHYMTPVAFEASLKDDHSAKMVLYDFSKVADEFFSGISNQNDSLKKGKEQTPHQELVPFIPVGQRYSSFGCSPAEPHSASLCQNKCNSKHNVNIKKL